MPEVQNLRITVLGSDISEAQEVAELFQLTGKKVKTLTFDQLKGQHRPELIIVRANLLVYGNMLVGTGVVIERIRRRLKDIPIIVCDIGNLADPCVRGEIEKTILLGSVGKFSESCALLELGKE